MKRRCENVSPRHSVWDAKRLRFKLVALTTVTGTVSLCSMKFDWFKWDLALYQLSSFVFTTALCAIPPWRFRYRMVAWFVLMITLVGFMGILEVVQVFLSLVLLPDHLLNKFLPGRAWVGENLFFLTFGIPLILGLVALPFWFVQKIVRRLRNK